MEDESAGFTDSVEQRGRVLLLLANPPTAVLDEVHVEDVGTDEERIVRLEKHGPPRVLSKQYGPGEQHSDALAPYHSGPDDALPDPDHVLQTQILAHQGHDAFVAGHELGHQAFERFVDRLSGGFAPLVRLKDFLGVDEPPVPHAHHPVGCRLEAWPLLGGADFGNHRALADWPELVTVPDVHQVHRWRVTLVHLERVYEELAFVPAHIDQNLRRVGNGLNGMIGVVVTDDSEIGNCVERQEVRTG